MYTDQWGLSPNNQVCTIVGLDDLQDSSSGGGGAAVAVVLVAAQQSGGLSKFIDWIKEIFSAIFSENDKKPIYINELQNNELKVSQQNQLEAISIIVGFIAESRSSAGQKGAFGSPGVGIGANGRLKYEPPEKPSSGQKLAAAIVSWFLSRSPNEIQDMLKGGIVGAVNAALGTTFKTDGPTQWLFETLAYLAVQFNMNK